MGDKKYLGRLVNFNEEDKDLFEYSYTIPNFSKWVREQLEIRRSGNKNGLGSNLDMGKISEMLEQLVQARLSQDKNGEG